MQPPVSEEFDDVYFSADGGPEETLHVFLNGNNLPENWQGRNRFTIAETGFGTGLNFLLAWEMFDRTVPHGAFLDYVSVEKFPMKPDDIRKGLAPWADRLEPYLSKMLAQYPLRVPGFHRIVFDGRVALTLIFDDANDALPEIDGCVDAWFLDGFTPAKNPDMWTDKVFGEMARLSHQGTTFATFTAAGFVKRGLREAGFHVEKRAGFGRKRDMLAGTYEGESATVFTRTCRDVSIFGAGLAGTSCAHVLRQYGLTPVLYDPNGLASGASGNPRGILNPRLGALRDPQSDFYTAGFAMAARTFPQFSEVEYNPCGALHLIVNEDKRKKFTQTQQNWNWAEEHLHLMDAREASGIAGIELAHDALYLPDSGSINPAALCAAYAGDLEIHTGAPIEGQDPVILAKGAGMVTAQPDIPLQTVRGQISLVDATEYSASLKTVLCYGGYLSPAMKGVHVAGSTFQKWLTHTDVLPEDNNAILAQLNSVVPNLAGLSISAARAALRTTAKDRFPLAGCTAEGTFISTAHGSHGIISSLISAHLLADILRGGVRCLGKSTVNALSPERFALREAQKKRRSGCVFVIE